MKILYFSALLCLLAACDAAPQPDTKAEASADAPQPSAQSLPATGPDLSVLQSTAPLEGKMLRRHTYGAGDCWGSITEYALPSGKIAVDSSTCGEYGFTYTRYLLDADEKLLALGIKSSETLFDGDEAAFSRTEHLLDFSQTPAQVQIKNDTIQDYAQREATLTQAFQNAPLPKPDEAYAQYQKAYMDTWKSESE